MKKNKIFAFFNMIEIALAMAVIAFGMTSLLALFPVGLNASRNSIAENYCSDAVEQFMAYIKFYAEKSQTNYTALFPNDGIKDNVTRDNTVCAAIDSTSNEQFLADFYNGVTTKREDANLNIYKYPCTGLGDVYFVLQGPQGSTKYDFSAMFYVWKTPVTTWVYDGSWKEDKDESYANYAGLNIEVSWPVAMPYKDRQKRYYYIEIKNPAD
jgi:hypothetical protein